MTAKPKRKSTYRTAFQDANALVLEETKHFRRSFPKRIFKPKRTVTREEMAKKALDPNSTLECLGREWVGEQFRPVWIVTEFSCETGRGYSKRSALRKAILAERKRK